MDLAAHIRAVEVLMSPLDWAGGDAWLAESLRRVRIARVIAGSDAAADAVSELEALLRLPGDTPGWLRGALNGGGAGGRVTALPRVSDTPETFLPVVSLRCALAAGLSALHRPEAWSMSPTLPTTQELRINFGLRGREPQVALLAAEGLTNAAIAERLRLSAHTVRHYLERVLERLGLHSRKALALHLMAGSGDRSDPARP